MVDTLLGPWNIAHVGGEHLLVNDFNYMVDFNEEVKGVSEVAGHDKQRLYKTMLPTSHLQRALT